MYEGNQREIDFGSSKREVRVSEGSSYRESTVFLYIMSMCDQNILNLSASYWENILNCYASEL